MREPIALERRIAVTIWRLATNVECRTLGELFGLGHSTVGKIVLENCEAIAQRFSPSSYADSESCISRWVAAVCAGGLDRRLVGLEAGLVPRIL